MQVASTSGRCWSGQEAVLLTNCSRYLSIRSRNALASSCQALRNVNVVPDSSIGGLLCATNTSRPWWHGGNPASYSQKRRQPCRQLSACTVVNRTDSVGPTSPITTASQEPTSMGSFFKQLKSGGSIPEASICNNFLRGGILRQNMNDYYLLSAPTKWQSKRKKHSVTCGFF